MRNGTAPLAALIIVACGCSEGVTSRMPWPGSVEAELDNLTGARTGVFRTYGPTHLLTAGRDSIPVTLGYVCAVKDDTEPTTAVDGLFFRIAMPDTSLVSDDEEAFEELSGQLGLLDAARMAVDGRVYAWQYLPTPTPTHGGWFLDGVTGFRPLLDVVGTAAERDSVLKRHTRTYEALARPARTIAQKSLQRRIRESNDRVEAILREGWSPAHDYVNSHYVGRDTIAIELKGVLRFSMAGFDAAVDSVRFWCPVEQSHHEWNAARVDFFRALDSLRTTSQEQAVGTR